VRSWRSSRWRTALGNLTLASASLALVLATLEVSLRLVHRGRGGGKEGQEEAHYLEYDPLLGWRKIPGSRVTYSRREYNVDVRINSCGLRDPERGYEAPPGTHRLLALGDSFLEGYTVPLEQTVTQVLERRLGEGGCPAEVINGGTAAYSTDQELLFFRSEGKRYSPRVVLVFFYYNDIVYNDRQFYFGRVKPAFQMVGEDGIELHMHPVRRAAASPPLVDDVDEDTEGSALLEWVRERLWAGAPRAHNLIARTGLWTPIRPQHPRLELRVYDSQAWPAVEEAWAKTAAVLRALAQDVREIGSRLLLVYVPSRMEVQDDSWALTRFLYGLEGERWDRGLVARRLARLGEADGYAVLDLTAGLRRADRGLLGRPYFDHDGHWTAIGHATAARELHVFLERREWLEECGRRGG